MLSKEQEKKAREIAKDIGERAAKGSLVGVMESMAVFLGKSYKR